MKVRIADEKIAWKAAEQLFPPTKKRKHRSKAQLRAQAIILSAIEDSKNLEGFVSWNLSANCQPER